MHSLILDLHANRGSQSRHDSHDNLRLDTRMACRSESEDTRTGNDGVTGRPCIKCMWWNAGARRNLGLLSRTPIRSPPLPPNDDRHIFDCGFTEGSLGFTEGSHHTCSGIWGHSRVRHLDVDHHFDIVASWEKLWELREISMMKAILTLLRMIKLRLSWEMTWPCGPCVNLLTGRGHLGYFSFR